MADMGVGKCDRRNYYQLNLFQLRLKVITILYPTRVATFQTAIMSLCVLGSPRGETKQPSFFSDDSYPLIIGFVRAITACAELFN